MNILNTNTLLKNINTKFFSKKITLEYIANLLPVGFCLHNENGHIIYSNKFYKELRIKHIPSQHSEFVTEERSFNVFKSTFLPPQGEKLFLTVLTETTETKRAQKEQEAHLAMITHDLKSSINSETQALKLLLNEKFGALDTNQREILELLYNTNLYAKLLINNTLTSYRIKTQGLNLNLSTFDICRTIRRCKDIYEISASEKDISLRLKLPEECFVKGDEIELQRVIMNLLGNAIKYGYEAHSIELELEKTDNTIFFHINSFGGYIPQKTMKKLFEKNVSFSMNGNPSGTGLGLYLCKEIIKAHKGEVVAQSFPTGLNIFGFKINISSSVKSQGIKGFLERCKRL